MKLLIEKSDLELLLEKKRDLIGNKVIIDTIIAGISFLLSVFTASYSDIFGISGTVLKTVFCLIGIGYTVKIIYDLFQANRHPYNHELLLNDIENLDKIQHDHSLVIIYNRDMVGTKRFLVYDDERWDCKLFLNYKTQARNNEAALLEKVSADLQIDKSQIHCRYITSRIQEKYSVSHKENRVYNHRLYEICIDNLSEISQKNDFLKNGKHFYWMTLGEMAKDDNIAKKNLDVIDFVKEVFG